MRAEAAGGEEAAPSEWAVLGSNQPSEGGGLRSRACARMGLVLAALALLLIVPFALASLDEVGDDFRISESGADTNPAQVADDAAVAYNATADEYLVVWEDDGHALAAEHEIFGQIIGADGTVVKDDFQISNLPNSAGRDAFDPDVAYNAADNEYLVVWEGDGLADDEVEVSGQRLEADGSEPITGVTGDFQISHVAADRDIDDLAVAHNPTDNEYLVVWEGDGLATAGELEIFGQRVEADGTETGTDFRISNAGADTDTTRVAGDPAIAFNSTAGATEFLVIWEQDGHGADDAHEIFGQRVDADGSRLGAGDGDFRISHANDVGAGRDAGDSAVAYNPADSEYLVAWEADALAATDDEQEIFGQRVDADGSRLGSGDGDFRISNVGADGDPARAGEEPSISYDGDQNEFLVSFQADVIADNEREIYGQRIDNTGGAIGSDFRFSEMTDAGDERDAFDPDAAYNPAAREHLVVWDGDGLITGNEKEIFGQFLAVPPPDLPDPPPADPPGPQGPDPLEPPLAGPVDLFDMRLYSNKKGVIIAELLAPTAGRFEGTAKIGSRKRASSAALKYEPKAIRSRPHRWVKLKLRPTKQVKMLLEESKPATVAVTVKFTPPSGKPVKQKEKLKVDLGKDERIAEWLEVELTPAFSLRVPATGLATLSVNVTHGMVRGILPLRNPRVPAKLAGKAARACGDLKPKFFLAFERRQNGKVYFLGGANVSKSAPGSFEFEAYPPDRGSTVRLEVGYGERFPPQVVSGHTRVKFKGKSRKVFCNAGAATQPY